MSSMFAILLFFTDLISAIIQVLARRAPVGAQGLLSENEFVAMCSTVFMELSELRHRGAFSAVAQAFAACCSRCHKLGHHELLDQFYKVSDGILPCCSRWEQNVTKVGIFEYTENCHFARRQNEYTEISRILNPCVASH